MHTAESHLDHTLHSDQTLHPDHTLCSNHTPLDWHPGPSSPSSYPCCIAVRCPHSPSSSPCLSISPHPSPVRPHHSPTPAVRLHPSPTVKIVLSPGNSTSQHEEEAEDSTTTPTLLQRRATPPVKAGREEEEGGSWKSLPLAPAGTQRKDPTQLQDLSNRVGQLTELVEEMAARFVLVETQLMLAKSQEDQENQRSLGSRGRDSHRNERTRPQLRQEEGKDSRLNWENERTRTQLRQEEGPGEKDSGLNWRNRPQLPQEEGSDSRLNWEPSNGGTCLSPCPPPLEPHSHPGPSSGTEYATSNWRSPLQASPSPSTVSA